MTLPTNEQVALWLDPQRMQPDWWKPECPTCKFCCGSHYYQPGYSYRYTGPDFTTPAACAEFVDPFLEMHDVWRVRGGHWTAIWFNAQAYFKETATIRDNNHQYACIMALAEVMK
jgi:hypothetical protein